MRISSLCGLRVFGVVLAVLAGSASGRVAGSAIDPDPAAPSLGELLQREEDARARLPLPPVRKPVSARAKAAAAAGAGLAGEEPSRSGAAR